VVDGVSSARGTGLLRAIAEAARAPKGHISLRARASTLDVEVQAVPPHGASDVTLVLVQPRARIAVARGENAGRTLDHAAIAREVRALGELGAGTPSGFFQAKLDSGHALTAVVILEQRSPRKVLGVSTVPIM
jgi:hypothetical protein